MTRRTRLAVLLAIAGALLAGGAAPTGSSASASEPNTWLCVDLDEPPTGLCVDNPFEPIEDEGGLVGILFRTLPS